MKSNWNFDSVKEQFKKSKITVLALIVGLSLGFASGQTVHSMNEASKEPLKIPVHADGEKGTHPRGFGFSFSTDPWMHSLMHDRFFRDFDAFSDMPASFAGDWRLGSFVSSPSIETSETASDIKITADVPGIDDKDLDVSVTDDTVTIKGEKKREGSVSDKDVRKSERFYGTFQRSFNLPCRVDSSKAEASLKNGVLTVVIPKSQLAQKESKKLTIKTQ
ncbi:MAG TPA: Hsp20/alpha crystallin family protein [Candidatus Melainabacteria bacterium]|nr:Hsp20/alpha crystallin family protein [Candidatus Melainabacteria bacterium]